MPRASPDSGPRRMTNEEADRDKDGSRHGAGSLRVQPRARWPMPTRPMPRIAHRALRCWVAGDADALRGGAPRRGGAVRQRSRSCIALRTAAGDGIEGAPGRELRRCRRRSCREDDYYNRHRARAGGNGPKLGDKVDRCAARRAGREAAGRRRSPCARLESQGGGNPGLALLIAMGAAAACCAAGTQQIDYDAERSPAALATAATSRLHRGRVAGGATLLPARCCAMPRR